MAKERQPIKVAIAGGGIAGLALAAGLAKKHKHIDFHIYEAVKEYQDVGAGLALHGNAIQAMTLIDPEVRDAYFTKALNMGEEDQELATEVIMVDGPNKGEQVAALGKAKGRKTVARSDLLRGFADLVPQEKISLGKRLEKIEVDEKAAGVKLTFKDGTAATADCLIGADGVHSVTRSYILGPNHPATAPKPTDNWHVYRAIVPMDVARETVDERWQRIVPILIGSKGYANSMPLSYGTRLSASIAVHAPKLDQHGEPVPLDPELYKDYREDAQQIVKLVAKHPAPSWALYDHDHAPTYYKGRVAMMGKSVSIAWLTRGGLMIIFSPPGDAAHTTFPFNGQGAAQALEDSAVLDALFSKLTTTTQIEAIFAAYDAVRRPRSQHVVDLSRKHGRVYQFMEGDMHERPQDVKEFFKYSGGFTNGADLQKQNDDAVAAFEKAVSKTANGHI